MRTHVLTALFLLVLPLAAHSQSITYDGNGRVGYNGNGFSYDGRGRTRYDGINRSHGSEWLDMGSGISLKRASFQLIRDAKGFEYGQALARFVDSAGQTHYIKNIVSRADCLNGYGQFISVEIGSNAQLSAGSFVIGGHDISSLTASMICEQLQMRS